VHPPDVQDRDGAVLVIEAIHQRLRHLFADSVYNGPNLNDALAKLGKWTIEIVKRATATPLGCRTNARLAQSQPPLSKGFRGVNRERQGVGLYRLCAATDQKTSLTCSCNFRKHNTTYTIQIQTLNTVSCDPIQLTIGSSWRKYSKVIALSVWELK